jgi:two-component system OmpR family response regulator
MAPTQGSANGSPEGLRILVVDDEDSITDLLATALRYERFDVEVAHTGREAIRAVGTFRPDLIVLDVMLPDWDGFEVTKRLADQRERVPILFLTARDATADRVRGLTLGGDDYVTKPFSLEELIARIRSILRRTRESEDRSAKLVFADLEMDDDTHQVWRAGQPIDLTPTEYNLLRFLLANAPRVLTKPQILDRVWNYDFGGDGNVVETYISYLRKKIDRVGPPLVHTVRGVGYCLRLPPE